MTSLKQRTAKGLKWSTLERFSSQGIRFVINIIIARILSPSAYGIIGMISIFLAISEVFIGGGFSAALIRKQNRTAADLSTVFYYNIGVSVFFYLFLYFFSPYIAVFYDTPELTAIIRIIGLNIIIGAFGAIQSTLLNIAIDFKTQTKISVVSIIFSGAVGIYMAYQGYGVWALVFQVLASTLISTALLWIFIGWKPGWVFSFRSFRELFSFGSNLMIAALLDAVYRNIYEVVIGKKFNAADLGFFTRAKAMVQLPSSNLTEVIQRVTFPVLSEIQDDVDKLAVNYRKLLKMSAFIIFPLMMLLFSVAEPLIKLLLTDKWLPAVPLLQVLCFGYMFYPIHAINLNLLQVRGRSDLFLRLEIIKKALTTVVLFGSAPFGVVVMCYGIVFTSVLSLVINTYYTGKLINTGFVVQVKDLLPILFISLITGGIAYLPSILFQASYVKLIAGTVFGGTSYLGISYFLKFDELNELKSLIFR